MKPVCRWAILVCFVVFVAGQQARAVITGVERVDAGLDFPVFATHSPGDRDRLFVLEKEGVIKIVDLNADDSQVAATFLTISDTDDAGEGGLLGLAFHPQYAIPDTPGYRKFYVNVTTGSPFTTRIREYSVSESDPNVADAGSVREILSYAQPQNNHNAGWIDFSPVDGYLYIASGDGGGGHDDDPGHTPGIGNSQDITNNLLGKMLRIDINGDDFPVDSSRNYAVPASNPFVGVTGDDEIWSYGLRNPFRDSFDRLTGDLWIGDVGQGQREEIDFQPADSAGGENYGWRLREGNLPTNGGVGGPEPANYVAPVYDYNRDNDAFGGTVVTGGYVYRGPDPSLQGQYFFLDSRNSPSTTDDNYWMFDPADPFGTVTNIDSLLNTGTGQFPVSFGEDEVGNLYIVYYTNTFFQGNAGQLFRIVTDELLPGDYDADGDVDDNDYQVWVDTFGSTTELDADGNGNDVIDAGDYTVWRDHRGSSVHNLGAASGASAAAGVPEPAALLFVAQLTTLLFLRMGRRR